MGVLQGMIDLQEEPDIMRRKVSEVVSGKKPCVSGTL